MQDQPEFHAVGGQLHRVIYEEVDQDAAEIEIQAQVDQAQTLLNAAAQVRQEAEQVYSEAETAAETASLNFDTAKKAEEDAESALQKSLAGRESLARAKQLAAEQLQSGNAEEVDSESDSEEPADGAPVNVPITLAS